VLISVEPWPSFRWATFVSRGGSLLMSGIGHSVIDLNCLIHGRRNFVEVVEDFPPECRFVIECLKGVYEIEADAKRVCIYYSLLLKELCYRNLPFCDRLPSWGEKAA